jgi:membrane-associated phospholipid phosphatase
VPLSWKTFRSEFLSGLTICSVFLIATSFSVQAQSLVLQSKAFERSPFFQTDSFFVTTNPILSGYARTEQNLDVRVLKWVYSAEKPVFSHWMATSDRAAYPIMFGTPIAVWAVHLAKGGISQTDAIRVSGAWLGATAGAMVLKSVIKRPRPFASIAGIQAKEQYTGARGLDAHASMPSGHAAISFALATALSLQQPKWYVVGPSAITATSIAVSRVWLGVHYPSDVVTGAALGVATAFIVHSLVR